MSIKGLKIGIPIEYYSQNLSKDVLETWNEITQVLEENGAIIKEVQMGN